MKNLWVETHRPDTLDDYVFVNQSQKEQIEAWIDSGMIPHVLFSGSAGIGKTTLAYILVKALKVNDYDLLEINASRENSVEEVRNKITNFVSTMPFGEFKIVLLDEADYLSPNAQAALRGVMETYASSARFILTCNYPNKIIPALHSRCQGFHFEKLDHTEFTARAATILVKEEITFELEILDSYVKATYPDLRKCLNLLQMNSTSGTLKAPSTEVDSSSDYRLAMVELFKKGKIREARQLLCSQARPEEMNDIISWCYNNLELWAKTPDGQDEAILVIRNAAANVPLIADHEINLSAMITELTRIKE